ncbi:MAG: hypothetical protein ACRDK5_11410 [Solirubrobacterales bacterium]
MVPGLARYDPESAAGEAYVKWLEAPASREDVQKLEGKLFDIEKQLREIRAVLEEKERRPEKLL